MAFNPNNGHYYVSSDSAKRIFDVNPGADGLVGTPGDTWSFFSTIADGNTNSDPEGVAFDTFNRRLYVADGLNREIYEYETNGTLVGHFDVLQYGVEDPESVEFNPVSGTLFVLGNGVSSIVVETTTSGALVQTVDVSAAAALKPAGLAYAPASSETGDKRFYIVDRGLDNNEDPDIVDGKLYELTAPAPAPPANTPPSVDGGTDQAAVLPASAPLDGTVGDDGNPIPPGVVTTTWSQVSGPNTVTFGDAGAIDTTASVPIPGIYVVRLTASDGELLAFDDVTLTFSGSGGLDTLDVRVNANPDDAEEVAGSGVVQRGDGDLDLMTDSADTKAVVGMRFNGVAVPPGADISYAYLQFQADETHSVATSLTIKGQAADNATTFQTVNFDVSSRPTTTTAATWAPDPWAAGEAGLAQRSSDLAPIIQEVVDRPGWVSSNSLVLLLTGSGQRVAVAHNQIPAAAPLLHVEWVTGSGNNVPQITSDGGGATASALPAENQTFVTDVDATDPDVDDTLTYSISGGADQAAFTIDSSSGVLSFASAPDHENPSDQGIDNAYAVTVRASDGTLTDEQAITATVHNVNEFSPVIVSDGGGGTAFLSRPENSTPVTVVDANDGDFSETLIYEFAGGADDELFQLDGSNGALSFNTPPDYENPADEGGDNVYEVDVRASDGSLSDEQDLLVTVTDVFDPPQPPQITSDGGGDTALLARPENSTAVTTVVASDPNPADTVSYSISGGTDATLFQIGGSSGVLTFVTGPDYENPSDQGTDNVYEVTVRASDGSLFDEQAISVGVTDVNENLSALYFSLRDAASVGGIAAANEDILFFDGTTGFSLHFDGSDVGIANLRIDAFTRVDIDTLLLSFDADRSVPGIGTVDDSDIVRFDGTLGAATSGTFSLYFDGSDVGLTATAHDLDAVELLTDGTILVSTAGAVTVPGVSAGRDEDLLAFTPTSLGDVTAGSFSMYFDGSDVSLGAEDVDAAAVDASGNIYLSVIDVFAVPGVSGDDEDVFVFDPTSTGGVTQGSYLPTLYFDGSAFGLAASDVFAIDLP
jgi:hypothetical protein